MGDLENRFNKAIMGMNIRNIKKNIGMPINCVRSYHDREYVIVGYGIGYDNHLYIITSIREDITNNGNIVNGAVRHIEKELRSYKLYIGSIEYYSNNIIIFEYDYHCFRSYY